MNRKHKRTLAAVFEHPLRADVPWNDVESLFSAPGAEISEGRGSRVRVALNGVRAVFHRPHPACETGRGMLRSVQRFLASAGIKP